MSRRPRRINSLIFVRGFRHNPPQNLPADPTGVRNPTQGPPVPDQFLEGTKARVPVSDTLSAPFNLGIRRVCLLVLLLFNIFLGTGTSPLPKAVPHRWRKASVSTSTSLQYLSSSCTSPKNFLRGDEKHHRPGRWKPLQSQTDTSPYNLESKSSYRRDTLKASILFTSKGILI